MTVSKVRAKKQTRRKSPLIPRMTDESSMPLSQKGLIQLRDLMTEGELMEVSLEETNIIWRILQATRMYYENTRLPDDEVRNNSILKTLLPNPSLKQK